MEHTDLSRNTLSFLGLAAEYCSALENALHTDKEEFTTLMLKLLPRLYITMSDTDTPIAATISESLADIYQPLLNCALAVRDAGAELAAQAVAECRESFSEYWAQTLCNVLRPLNALHYNI